MKFKKILLLDYSGEELGKSYWNEIDKLCEKKILVSSGNPSLEKQFKETDCLLVKLGAKIGSNLIDKAPKLKYIGMLGTGCGGIDSVYAARKKIIVCNITDYATEGVAEFIFGMIIDYLRELERAKKQVRKGDYSEADFMGTEIKDKNFGVVGLGNIGARTAQIAKAFGAKVNYWSKHRKKIHERKGIQYRALNDVLKNSDFISINLSLNPNTKNFLNKSRLGLIKKGAVVINPSPMELLDFNALVNRIKKGDFTLILDHSDEMTPEQLKKIKPYANCILYPPLGYTTKEATVSKQGIFVNNLKSFLKGTPSNKVN